MLRRISLFITLYMCVFVSHGIGQSTPAPPAPSEGWNVRVTPYLWASGLKGRVGIGTHVADVDASFGDLFRELNFAFSGLFAANRDRFILLTDVAYMNLSDERATAGPLFSGVDVIKKTFILGPQAGYRITGSQSSFVDILGGIRFWHVGSELEFEPGVLEGLEVSGSRNWVDGILGLRGQYRLSPSWSISGYGDIGGGGSNLTYQLIGIATADLDSGLALVFGYRYLNTVYNKDGFLFDTAMGGPILGVTFKF